MLDFLNSKFMNDLEQGKLPPLQVTIEPASIILLCAGLLITFVLMRIANDLI